MDQSMKLNAVHPATPHTAPGGSRGLWLTLRLFCQILVVVYYMNVPQFLWQRAIVAIGTGTIVGINIILLIWRDDVLWKQVQRVSLLVECVLVTILSGCLLVWQPIGPAALIVLPSLITYTSLYNRDGWQWFLSFVPLMELVWMVNVDINAPHQRPLLPAVDSLSLRLIVALYAVIILIAIAFAFLLQVQHHERETSLLTTARVREQADRLRMMNAQMNEYADKVYHLATAEERNRIAGEIHDTVAHRLTALLVQLQAARRIWTQDADVETTRENLVVCEALAREALDEVRTSVRAIRRTSADEGITALRRLVLQFTQLTGMETFFETDSRLGQLPAQVMAVLYRIIQEALTNAQRHGRATRVTLKLRRNGGFVELEVEDNGKGTAELVLGFGLSSMQNRLRQYGGELNIASEPGFGFRLTAQLPVWEGAFE
ncbi:sensor histidine kinase [Alicyclobacillus dauci]|uniref:histidine kinase n=1 Tax=Alicyclobacillus dauci TaxID=1475485 RepID=A0ABY6Z6J5_9BACL|nr:sensor histidine kinase [Alicyclobacillus dauci]WAH38227.1 sensor histidine kinase [Alicyclobacillus dauci]